jgi:glutathione S-transferase
MYMFMYMYLYIHTLTHTLLAHTQVPMLEIDGLCIVQCEAILRYLARKNDMLGADLAESVSLSKLN